MILGWKISLSACMARSRRLQTLNVASEMQLENEARMCFLIEELYLARAKHCDYANNVSTCNKIVTGSVSVSES